MLLNAAQDAMSAEEHYAAASAALADAEAAEAESRPTKWHLERLRHHQNLAYLVMNLEDQAAREIWREQQSVRPPGIAAHSTPMTTAQCSEGESLSVEEAIAHELIALFTHPRLGPMAWAFSFFALTGCLVTIGTFLKLII